MWNVGDNLSIFNWDLESERVLGKIVSIKKNETDEDWTYILENGTEWDEGFLLSEHAFKK